MNIADIGITHLRYHRWATAQVLEECLPLPSEVLLKNLKTSFQAIHGTLVHLFQADSIWLDRLCERPVRTRDEYGAPGCMYELRDAWTEVQENMIEWAGRLKEQDWSRVLSYKTLAGAPYESSVWQIILHVVNLGRIIAGKLRACCDRWIKSQ